MTQIYAGACVRDDYYRGTISKIPSAIAKQQLEDY